MLGKIITVLLVLISICGYAMAEEQLLSLKHDGERNYFELSVPAGNRGVLAFDVYNGTDEEIVNKLLIYESMTAMNGGNEIMSPEEFSCNETAGWFAENCLEIRLAGKAEKHFEIPFDIPIDARPGVYTAILGLYSSADTLKADSGHDDGIGINLNNFYTTTVAIVINVGEKPKGSVIFGETAELACDPKSGVSYLYIPIRNIGDTYEFPIVEVSLHDSQDVLIYSETNVLDIFYRRTDAYACFDLGGGIAKSGQYNAKCQLKPKYEGRFPVQTKTFLVSQSDKMAREALIGQLVKNDKNSIDMDSGYFILGKKQLIIGFGITVVLIMIICAVLISIKKRKARAAERN